MMTIHGRAKGGRPVSWGRKMGLDHAFHYVRREVAYDDSDCFALRCVTVPWFSPSRPHVPFGTLEAADHG